MPTVSKLPNGKWRAMAYKKDPVTGKVSRPSFTRDTKNKALRAAIQWEEEHQESNDVLNLTLR